MEKDNGEKPHLVSIVINGKPMKYDGEYISYEFIVETAFPDKRDENDMFTVSYRGGPVEKPDTLVRGQKTKAHDGMVILADYTGRS